MMTIEMKVERETQVQNRFNHDEMDDVSVDIDIEVEVINVGSPRKPVPEINTEGGYEHAFEVETGNVIKLEPSERQEAIDKAYNEFLNDLPNRC